MIKVVEGNVIDAVLNGECDFMLHVTNAKHVMGSGVAKEVKERIPSAYTNYLETDKNEAALSWSDDYECFNLTAQKDYGRLSVRYLKYDWFIQCIESLKTMELCLQNHFGKSKLKIAIPCKMGSDRAGGDWRVICELLEGMLGHHEIIAYKL